MTNDCLQVPSPKITVFTLKMGHPKGKLVTSLPSIHFRVRTIRFREGKYLPWISQSWYVMIKSSYENHKKFYQPHLFFFGGVDRLSDFFLVLEFVSPPSASWWIPRGYHAGRLTDPPIRRVHPAKGPHNKNYSLPKTNSKKPLENRPSAPKGNCLPTIIFQE